MKGKEYHLLLPEKLQGWLKEFEKRPPDITGFSISRMQYIISAILTHKQDKHPGAWSVLNMQYLKNIVPQADKYVNYLKTENIIECKNHYAGRNSRLYRLTRDHEGPAIYRTLTDQNLARRMEKTYSQIKQKNSRKYKILNKYVYAVGIDIDKALHTIDEKYKAGLMQDSLKAEARRTFSLAEIMNISSKQIYTKVNNTNGRYDTNFTRLPSELVPCLTIDGTPLTEIDIVNSQPLIASALFDPSPEVEKIMVKYLGKKYTMYIKNLHLTDFADVMQYRILVKNGQFYEFMMQKFQQNKIPFTDRQDFKKQLFTIFFGRVNAIHYSPAVRLFKALFPNIYNLFTGIKADNHNRLAILLQRIESFTILDVVVNAIIRELPDLKFITKHDSLLPSGFMVPGRIAEVEKIICTEVEKIIGVEPKLKIKGLAPYSSNLSLSNTSLIPLCIPKPCN